MAGPKIKVEADLSSFNEQINQLKAKIAELNSSLAAGSKNQYTFSGSKKQLDALLKTAEQLTKALDAGDKKSKQYAQSLKQAAAAMSDAAKLSSRLEEAGGSSNHHVSGYFRQYSSELRTESSAVALQRDREATEARRERERQQRNANFINRVSRLGGAVAGAALGGGGGYASLGGAVGGLFGPIGGIVGGALGGFADRTIGTNKDEALKYSELRRSLGGVTVDFEMLRSSVRNTVTGLGVTNVEAATLAKNFAKTANLSADINSDISRSVGTAAGLGQSYGMAPGQSADFLATMRVNNIGRNDQDNKRIAMQIGEAVARSGTSVKMDETMSAIGQFVSKSASQTMTTPDFGSFTSLLTAMTGSGYAGLRGNVSGVGGLIDRANSGVLGAGSAGEASQSQWMTAQFNAIPGLNGLDVGINQSAGLLGNLSSMYAPESPIYDNADKSTKAHYDSLRKNIKGSGYRNMLGIGLSHAKSISRNSQEENINIQKMFGLGSAQEAAVLKKFSGEMQANGRVESILGKHGIGLNDVDASMIGPLSTIISGSASDRKNMFNSMKGRLSKEDLAAGENALSGGDASLQSFLIDAVKKGSVTNDPGLEAQKTSVEIQNKMAGTLDTIVDIENFIKEGVLGIWRKLDPDSKQLNILDRSSLRANGKDMYGGNAFRSRDVTNAVSEINSAGSMDEKKRIAKRILGIYDQQERTGFPLDTEKQIENALYPPDKKEVSPASSDYGDKPTISAWSGLRGLNDVQRKAIAAAKRHGIPPSKILALLKMESSNGTNLHGSTMGSGEHAGDQAGGVMQYMAKTAREKGIDRFNVDQSLNAGAEDLARRYKRYGSWEKAFAGHLGGDKGLSRDGLIPNRSDGHITMREYGPVVNRMSKDFTAYDQIPENQRQSAQVQDQKFHHEVNVNLRDSQGRPAADPVRVSSISKPVPAGVR